MKTRIKVMSLIFAFAATLASCEKDDTQPSATNNNHTTSEIQQADKKSNGTNKSNEVDIELSNFIESVVYDFGDLSTMNATNALELTESTLYWKFSNYDAIPGETQMFDLNYDVSLTYMNGEWLISTTSILALNEAISLDLNNIGAGASSNEGSTGAKYWFEMDVIVPDNPADYSPTYNVKVKATLGFKSSGNCNQMVAWKGYINGKCSSPSNKYVVSVVTSKLNNPNCSFSNVEYCGGTIGSGHTTVYNKIQKELKDDIIKIDRYQV